MNMYRAVEDHEQGFDPEYVLPTGQSIESVAQSARRVFLSIVLQGPPSAWEGLKSDQKERWFHVAGVMARILLSEQPARWFDAAKACHRAFHQTDTWESTAPPLQVAWEAVARHIANIGWTAADEDTGESDDRLEGSEIVALEKNWKMWVAERLSVTLI